MKLLSAFFRLIRWQNLLFIAINQYLFFYCIFIPLVKNATTIINHTSFLILAAASILIAAAGYIINDYFDIQIDVINKPSKMVINKYIKRRWAIVWHLAFSFIGVLLSVYVSFKTNQWLIAIVNFICVLMLWFYSTTFKKKLLIGNVIIAFLTAWVVLVVYVFAGADFFSLYGWANEQHSFNVRWFFKITMLYAGFAFIVTLVREVIKDIEDVEGDRKYNCHTMPIVWGIPATKVFAAVWLVVLIAALTIIQLYAWQSGYWLGAIYIVALLILPMAWLLKKLFTATNTMHFHSLSSVIKYIILIGILSMLLLKFT